MRGFSDPLMLYKYLKDPKKKYYRGLILSIHFYTFLASRVQIFYPVGINIRLSPGKRGNGYFCTKSGFPAKIEVMTNRPQTRIITVFLFIFVCYLFSYLIILHKITPFYAIIAPFYANPWGT